MSKFDFLPFIEHQKCKIIKKKFGLNKDIIEIIKRYLVCKLPFRACTILEFVYQQCLDQNMILFSNVNDAMNNMVKQNLDFVGYLEQPETMIFDEKSYHYGRSSGDIFIGIYLPLDINLSNHIFWMNYCGLTFRIFPRMVTKTFAIFSNIGPVISVGTWNQFPKIITSPPISNIKMCVLRLQSDYRRTIALHKHRAYFGKLAYSMGIMYQIVVAKGLNIPSLQSTAKQLFGINFPI